MQRYTSTSHTHTHRLKQAYMTTLGSSCTSCLRRGWSSSYRLIGLEGLVVWISPLPHKTHRQCFHLQTPFICTLKHMKRLNHVVAFKKQFDKIRVLLLQMNQNAQSIKKSWSVFPCVLFSRFISGHPGLHQWRLCAGSVPQGGGGDAQVGPRGPQCGRRGQERLPHALQPRRLSQAGPQPTPDHHPASAASPTASPADTHPPLRLRRAPRWRQLHGARGDSRRQRERRVLRHQTVALIQTLQRDHHCLAVARAPSSLYEKFGQAAVVWPDARQPERQWSCFCHRFTQVTPTLTGLCDAFSK